MLAEGRPHGGAALLAMPAAHAVVFDTYCHNDFTITR